MFAAEGKPMRPGVGPPLAILGSGRSRGETAALLERLIAGLDCRVIDLLQESVLPFSYGADERKDSFSDIISLVAAAPVVVLATPVYWYSYSAQMKCFIDRFYDLPARFPDVVARLRGKQIVLLACGETPELEAALNLAFNQFCDALGMHCVALVYGQRTGPFTDPAAVRLVRERMTDPSKTTAGFPTVHEAR